MIQFLTYSKLGNWELNLHWQRHYREGRMTTLVTRMLAINASIPNGTVARLEQFRSPQLPSTNPERATNRHRGWLKTNHPLYESLVSLFSVSVHLQLMQSQNWLPWQRPLDPRSRLCLHWIAWPRKHTPRIKQRLARCHTAEVISIQSLPAPTPTPRG